MHKLKIYFEKTDDTPKHLAERVDCHVSTIYRILTGVRHPGRSLMLKIQVETGGIITPMDFMTNN